MPTPTVRNHRLDVEGLGSVEVGATETGDGRPALLLDGGAGHETTPPLAELLTGDLGLRVITPILARTDNTSRPSGPQSVAGLAALYLQLCDELELTDVTVVGHSKGRSIAAEMATLGSARIARVILIGTAGPDVPDHPVDAVHENLSSVGAATLVLSGHGDGAGHPDALQVPAESLAAISTFLGSHAAWTHAYTIETTVTPDAVWAALRDLFTGTKIADTSDSIVIHGPFAAGTELDATPHGADFSIRGLITELVEGRVFALRARVNGVFVTARHTLTPLRDGGCRVTHHSEITGPRAEILGPQIGPRITKDHPQAMDDLINAARARSAHQQNAPAAVS